MLLENEVQDLAEDHPDQAHLLMDQLTQPLQLYQDAAQMAEQRTTFLSKVRHAVLCEHCTVLYCDTLEQEPWFDLLCVLKMHYWLLKKSVCKTFAFLHFLYQIPTCLQEFEGIIYSATCWLDEAQSWLSTPCSFTTARNLQNHANSLQVRDTK